MVLGVSFSGGGITAIICTLCLQRAIINNETAIPPAKAAAARYSVVSGGTIGLALHDVGADSFWFPDLANSENSSTAYTDLSSKTTTADHPNWYGEVLDFIPVDTSLSSIFKVLKDLGLLSKIIGKANWWLHVMETIFKSGYGISTTEETVFYSSVHETTLVNFALVAETESPVARTDTGYLKSKDARSALWPSTLDTSTGFVTVLRAAEAVSVKGGVSELAALSASSSFWNAGIITGSSLEFAVAENLLMKYKVTDSNGSGSLMAVGNTCGNRVIYFLDVRLPVEGAGNGRRLCCGAAFVCCMRPCGTCRCQGGDRQICSGGISVA